MNQLNKIATSIPSHAAPEHPKMSEKSAL
uniref:Uncharacterized protein n=1 Tax=Arundo donax TaxID=35708 RepID=A0A0A9AQ56_ARUDO